MRHALKHQPNCIAIKTPAEQECLTHRKTGFILRKFLEGIC